MYGSLALGLIPSTFPQNVNPNRNRRPATMALGTSASLDHLFLDKNKVGLNLWGSLQCTFLNSVHSDQPLFKTVFVLTFVSVGKRNLLSVRDH